MTMHVAEYNNDRTSNGGECLCRVLPLIRNVNTCSTSHS